MSGKQGREMATVLIIGLGVLSWGGGALCQADPWTNAIGIYFDETATTNEVHVQGPATLHGYLVATHLQIGSGIGSWWGGLMSPIPVRCELRGGGSNLSDNGPAFHVNLDVTCSAPLAAATTVVLADLYWEIVNAGIAYVYVDAVYESPHEGFGCQSGTAVVPLAPATGCINVPCWAAWVATINGGGPVPIDEPTWGDLKNLYR